MVKSRLFVLDTHILIWYFTGSPRLKQELKDHIDKIRDRGGRLLVPTIVLSEALHISQKNRVRFDFSAMYRLLQEEPEFEIVGFGPEIFEETMRIKGIPEIHDRIIAATAKFYGAGILTKDRVIHSSGEVETL